MYLTVYLSVCAAFIFLQLFPKGKESILTHILFFSN